MNFAVSLHGDDGDRDCGLVLPSLVDCLCEDGVLNASGREETAMETQTRDHVHGTWPMFRVLFVCTGNICRSPLAESIFRSLVVKRGLSERIAVASAGTSSCHVGESPDPCAQRVALANGIDLSGIRARDFQSQDFEDYDNILALDRRHLRTLNERCQNRLHRRKLSLLTDFSTHYFHQDVADPYYDPDIRGFDTAFTVIEESCLGLLTYVQTLCESDESEHGTVAKEDTKS